MVLRHWAIVLNNLWLCCSSNEIPGTFFVIVTAQTLQPRHSILKTKIYTQAFCWKLPSCNLICDIVSLSDAVAMVIKAQFDLLEATIACLSDRLLASELIHDSQCTSACCIAGDEFWVKWQMQRWSDDPLFATATGKLSTHVPSRRCPTVRRKSAPSGRLWGRTPGRCASRGVCSTCAAPAPRPA